MKKTIVVTCSNYEFLRNLVDLIAPGMNIRIGACNDNVEIIGRLPRSLRRGLKRGVIPGVALPFPSRNEPAGPLVWRAGRTTLNIQNVSVLANLLAEVAALKGQK